MGNVSGVTSSKTILPGGQSKPRPLNYQDRVLFEQFRNVIEYKLRSRFPIPKNFVIEPVQVRTQVVAGTNYYFYVPLPNNQLVVIKINRPLPGGAYGAGNPSSLVTVQLATAVY